MRCLGIETSTNVMSLALVEAGEVLLEVEDRREHSRAHELWRDFLSLSRAKGFHPKQVNRVVVSVGPGRFSGIRSGVALGVGWTIALGCPILGIPSLDGLAYSLRDSAVVGEIILAYLPKPGSQEYFARCYIWEEVGPCPKDAMKGLDRASLTRLAQEATWVVGPDSGLKEGPRSRIAWPRASTLACWVSGDVVASLPVFPLAYVASGPVH